MYLFIKVLVFNVSKGVFKSYRLLVLHFELAYVETFLHSVLVVGCPVCVHYQLVSFIWKSSECRLMSVIIDEGN